MNTERSHCARSPQRCTVQFAQAANEGIAVAGS